MTSFTTHIKTDGNGLTAEYESSSGFKDVFSRIMGTTPAKIKQRHILKASWIDTPLGPMIAIADDLALYLLEFVERRGLEREIERMRKKTHSVIIPGITAPIRSIQKELSEYFAGRLKHFETPVRLLGSLFQQSVWEELKKIPLGQTRSYTELAQALGRPSARRAVARANGCNQLAILIPCHRVINANGELGGYAGGLARKQWLLDQERNR